MFRDTLDTVASLSLQREHPDTGSEEEAEQKKKKKEKKKKKRKEPPEVRHSQGSI